MLSIFQGPPNISWHRAPKKLDSSLVGGLKKWIYNQLSPAGVESRTWQ